MFPSYLGGAISRHDFLVIVRTQGVEMRHVARTAARRQYYLVRPPREDNPVHFFFTDGTDDGLIDAMTERLLPDQVVECCLKLGLDPQLFGWTRPDGDV